MQTVLRSEKVRSTLLEQLIQSPKLPLYLKQLQEFLDKEQQKREEFYQMIAESDKAEFINGEVVFQSPVKLQHDAVSGALFSLIRTFVAMRDLGYVGHEKIMVSLTRNDYKPDICFFSKTKSEQFLPEQTRFPAPDFIVEVLSDSTETKDRETKFEDYAAHGVSEYWLVDPSREFVEQYILQGESYELLIKSNSGCLTSAVITDFEIPIRAIFDEKENLKALQELVSST
ncbi:TPA: Uma2 family endonuclease [Candidatus Poribacteria bacterium]|nr:Uma2 family endonuclease [Candidatus Poribacteria bacterium]